MHRQFLKLALAALLVCPLVSAATIIDKAPDQGPFWNSLGPSGTSIYANSFVFAGGPVDTVDTLGIYLLSQSGGLGGSIRFELWGDNGNAPDGTAVLGVTNYFQADNATLELITASLLSPVSLTNGDRYWVIGSGVGQAAGGGYQVGGHTQNSVYNDNGTFWYSNDANGINFDGQSLTPEMAIFVGGDSVSDVPEPSTLLSMAAGALALGFIRRRRVNL